MFRKHLIYVLVTGLSLVVAPRPAPATTARLASLAGGDFLEDDHNVQRWYGSLGDYPSLVVLEAGHFTLPAGWHDQNGNLVSGPGLGAHWHLDEAGRWGTAAVFLNGFSDDVDPGGLSRSGLGTSWTGMWSRRFGRWQPTLMYRHASESSREILPSLPPATVYREFDRWRDEFGAGVRWDIGAGAYLDLAGEVRHHSEQVTLADPVVTVPGDQHKSTGSWGVRARSFVRLAPTLALVPTLEYLRDDRALPSLYPLRRQSLDGHLVKVGTGLNWYPDPDHLLVVGLDYLHADADYLATLTDGPTTLDSTRDWESLAFTMGFESRFRYWLTIRGSVRYEPVWFGQDTDPAAADFATFMVNLGAALQLGPYDLDLAVTDQEPRSVAGYYGNSLFGNPATWLTVSLRRTFSLP